jgi:type IV pilus biogenesis/stability protein PilW
MSPLRDFVAVMLISTVISGCTPTLQGAPNRDQGRDRYLRGVNYLNVGAPELAIRELWGALEQHENQAEVYNALGLAYHLQKKYPLAEEQFKQAIALNPRFSEAHLNYSALLLDTERWDEAIVEAEHALANPTYQTPERAYHNLGSAYYQKGLLTVAASSFQKALEYNPNFAYANYYLGRIYFQTNRFVEAIQEFQSAIQRDPLYLPAYYQLGLVYHKNGEREKAQETLQKVIALAPQSEWARESRTYLEALK